MSAISLYILPCQNQRFLVAQALNASYSDLLAAARDKNNSTVRYSLAVVRAAVPAHAQLATLNATINEGGGVKVRAEQQAARNLDARASLTVCSSSFGSSTPLYLSYTTSYTAILQTADDSLHSSRLGADAPNPKTLNPTRI